MQAILHPSSSSELDAAELLPELAPPSVTSIQLPVLVISFTPWALITAYGAPITGLTGCRGFAGPVPPPLWMSFGE